ncbi:MAG TPA: hypothetical protein VGS19_20985 [Streptosporangiaceae bacterium]|nr:hypothetical protein [Streptosporangiaceae bacterium]
MFSSRVRWRRARMAAWACAAACVVALVTAGAGFVAPLARAWTVSKMPVPQVSNGKLAGEACTSPAACWAVGFSDGPGGTSRTLVAAWNGASWSIQASPDPKGARGAILDAVSCPASAVCAAVGSSMNGSATAVPLAETWDGTSWSIQPVPVPAGSFGAQLTGVSCSAVNACVAVGYYENLNFEEYSQAFAETWNGSAWALLPGTTPSSIESALDAVSCSGPGACVATGWYASTGTRVPLAESWNGSAWTVQSVPAPGGSALYSASLTGVSCTAATACTAVGGYSLRTRPYPDRTLAESWNGTSWTIQSTPDPVRHDGLAAVSCTAADACTAVGSYSDSSGEQHTLAEAWNGTAWTVQGTHQPTGVSASSLTGVACGTVDSCSAVGWSNYSSADQSGVPRTLALTRTGTSWAIAAVPSPHGSPGAQLGAVSCPAPHTCVAVGSVAEVWNGSGWKLLRLARPSGATAVNLSGVSCVARNACTAVGSYQDSSGHQLTLAESWDGFGWRVQSAPSPPGAASSLLSGVSCAAASACMAVGSYQDSSGHQLTLAESWDGTSWDNQPTVDPADARNIALSAVSCTAATACVAVGQYQQVGYGYPYRPLAEAWNGTTWSRQQAPGPQGSTMNAVSCVTVGSCVAVGYAGAHPLVLTWNGTAWSKQLLRLPANSYEAFLGGVSCPAAGDCTATGYADQYSTGNSVTLGESWNGTAWSQQPTPDPRGFQTVTLGSVSCSGADTCTALGTVGQMMPNFGPGAPFAAQRH